MHPTSSILILLVFLLPTLVSSTYPARPDDDSWVEEVYGQLLNAIGDKSRDFPGLVFSDSEEIVAGYNQKANMIVIERKAVRVCERMGSDRESAMAFLLAHELTHYYQNHQWQNDNTGFLFKKQSSGLDLEEEKEADAFGTFIMYLSGYDIAIPDRLIDSLYYAYTSRAGHSEYYLSVDDRRGLAGEVAESTGELIRIFETANYLYAAGQIGGAAVCYEYLLKFFKCKELLNNYGAAAVTVAARIPNASQQSFAYPLTLDLRFPVRDGGSFERGRLLEKAIRNLEEAVAFDPTYFPGMLNLASAYILDENYKEAQETIQQLQKLVSGTEERAKVTILEGIVAAHRQELRKASDYFDRARKEHKSGAVREIADFNKKILKARNLSESLPSWNMPPELIQIDGIDLKYEPDINFDKIIPISSEKQGYQISWKNFDHSILTVFRNDSKWALIRVIREGVTTGSGIGVGATADAVRNAYGNPEQYLLHASGYFMVYPGRRLIFKLGAGEIVSEWSTYAQY